MKKIICFAGTRPEAIKLAPVIRELRSYPEEFTVRLCSSGQHRELLYQALADGRDGTAVTPIAHLPLAIPYFIRRLWRGVGNRGDVKYSSGRLIAEGFKFPLGVTGAVRKVIRDRRDVQ